MYELEILHTGRMEGVNLFLNTVDFRTAHFHAAWELVWVLENALHVVCEQHEYIFRQNELFLLNPNMVHEFHKVEEGCTFLCLQVGTGALPSIHNLMVDNPRLQENLTPEQLDQLRQTLVRAVRSYMTGDTLFELECNSLISGLIYTILTHVPCHQVTMEEVKQQQARNARLKRLLQFVDDNYMHRICLTDFAKQEGCSMSYLSHFVKAALNQSFQDYVNSVRFNCACKLIKSGKVKMLDVCMASGFSDYRYFVKAFRKQCGMTPVEYSRQVGNISGQNLRERSLHSSEQYYTDQQCMEYFDEFDKIMKQ